MIDTSPARRGILASVLVLAALLCLGGTASCDSGGEGATSATVPPEALIPTTGVRISPSDPVVSALGELDAVGDAAQIPIYYLGPSYGVAPLVEAMARRDGYAVTIVYRNTDPEDLLSINIVEYDPVRVPELKKPLDWWIPLRTVQAGPQEDAVYRSESGHLFYVATRGPIEINVAGYSKDGTFTETQLIDIAQNLVRY